MPINSRAKGKKGELLFCHWLRQFGYWCRRGRQYQGGDESPDVVTALDHLIFVDVKNVQNLKLVPALEQVRRDAPAGVMPVVMWKKNGREWIAILPAKDLIRLIEQHLQRPPREPNPGTAFGVPARSEE